MPKILLIPLLLCTLAMPARADAATKPDPHTHVKYGAILPDYFWDRVAQCETASNWQHSTRSYTGGLGIYRRSAYAYSGRLDIGKLSPAKQVKIAERLAFLGWVNPKTNKKTWPVGAFGWGTVANNCMGLKTSLCQSKAPEVQRFKHRC
jgi:hypothetical protein